MQGFDQGQDPQSTQSDAQAQVPQPMTDVEPTQEGQGTKRKMSGKGESTKKRVRRKSKIESQTADLSDLYSQAKSYKRQSGGGGYRTRGSEHDKTLELQKQKQEAEEKKQQDYLDRLTKVEKARLKAPDGHKGDGKLHMAFIQMGQGDCTIISTPAGKSILIDCGSTATEQGEDDITYHQRIADIIFGQGFLQNENHLDILILTHPDRDHYNMLKRVVEQKSTTFTINTCYHSCLFSGYSQMETSTWIWSHMEEVKNPPERKDTEGDIVVSTVNSDEYPIVYTVREVTARASYQKENIFVTPQKSSKFDFSQERKFTAYNQPGKSSIETDILLPAFKNLLDDRGVIKIVQEEHCTVSILASNVWESHPKTDDTTFNKCSAVVLIEAFGQKIMVCGDATGGTENFICRTYSNVNNLDLLQVPHHGSVLTSSTQAFVDQMQPKCCVISAPQIATQHPHPSTTVIKRYLKYADKLPEGKPPYDATTWTVSTFAPILASSTKVDTQNKQSTILIDKAIYITGSYGTYIYDVSDPNSTTIASMDTSEDTATTTNTATPIVPVDTQGNTTNTATTTSVPLDTESTATTTHKQD